MSTFHANPPPGTGIGNRLKAIASACMINGNNHVTIWWDQGGWYHNQTKYILEEALTIDNTTIINQVNMEIQPSYHEWRLWVNPERLPKGFSKNLYNRDFDGRCIDYEYHNIPKPIIDEYKLVWNRFHPTETILKRVSQIPQPKTSIQVRISKDKEWSMGPGSDRAGIKTECLDLVIHAIEKIDGPAYLAAIDEEIVELLKYAFPGKLYTLPNLNRKSFVDAIAELVIMGQSDNLHVTDYSTFGEVAWWLGGCHAHVKKFGENKNFSW